jgi:ABC-type glycerol-3-phosphate transport system substrate-binding protein
MKKCLSLIIAIVIAVSFTGCSKKNKEEKNTTTIKIATFYPDKEQGEIYKEIGKKYEEKNKNVKIQIINDFSDTEKINEEISQKGDIDIIGLKRDQLIQYAKSGLLTDLSDFAEQKALSDKLYKINLAYGSCNGKLYGIGDMPASIEWFYNKDIFDKYNMKEPENISDLEKICSKLKGKKINPVNVGAMDGWTLTEVFGMITSQTTMASNITSAYGSDETAYKNIKGMDEAFNIYGKLTSGCINKNSIDVNYRKSVEDFVTGKAAILPAGSWAEKLIKQIKPSGFNYGVFKKGINFVDTPVTKYSATAGQILVVPAKSKNLKIAKDFIEFFYSEDAQKLFKEKGYAASLKSLNTENSEVDMDIQSHLEAADENSVMLLDNLEPKVAETLTSILSDVLEDRTKPKEAWSRVLKLSFQ